MAQLEGRKVRIDYSKDSADKTYSGTFYGESPTGSIKAGRDFVTKYIRPGHIKSAVIDDPSTDMDAGSYIPGGPSVLGLNFSDPANSQYLALLMEDF